MTTSLVGSGEIAMILSSAGIAKKQNIGIEVEKPIVKSDLSVENNGTEQLTANEYMLFKYDPENFLCLHLDDVERLVKIEPGRVESVGTNFVVRYLDKVLPIIEPAGLIGLQDNNLKERLLNTPNQMLEIIVVNIGEKLVGLLVSKLDEIHKSYEDINTDTISNPGLEGSIFINGSTICILDLAFLMKKYNEKWTLNRCENDELLVA